MTDTEAALTLERAEMRVTPPRRGRRRRRKGWVLPVYAGLVIAYLFLPIAVMIAFGFNDYKGKFNLTWEGFTTRHWGTLFQDPDLVTALKNSLTIAAIVTIVSTILGTLVALALTKYKFRGRSPLNVFIFLPMATPEIVLGASLLTMFITLGVPRGFGTILIAHIMFSISYVVVTVKARTAGFNVEWEEAAKDLGATPWVTFWTVTFPLILPGVAAAAALAFALSVDDYVVTTFNSGQTVTFPLWVFGASRQGIPAQVNIMGTLIFFFGVALALFNVYLQRRRS
ncbi:MAG: ABC transporter permease [Actinomycetota bacterium]